MGLPYADIISNKFIMKITTHDKTNTVMSENNHSNTDIDMKYLSLDSR